MGHHDRVIAYSDTCRIVVAAAAADCKALKVTGEKLSQGLQT